MSRKNNLKQYYTDPQSKQLITYYEYVNADGVPGSFRVDGDERIFVPYETRDNDPRMSLLQLRGFRRGRSSFQIELYDEGLDLTLWGGSAAFQWMINKTINANCVVGTWQIFKRGSNFLLDFCD